MATADLQILLKLKDEASKELKAISGPGGLGGLEKAAIGAGLALAGGLAAGLASSISKAAEFEKEISAIKAVTGATAEEAKQLGDVALQLGKDTSFSALESAKGIEELAKAGVSIADISEGAAKAGLNLAAAMGEDVTPATQLAATAMNLFGIEGKDMGGVVDQIAGFANATTGSMTDFKFSLSAVGGVAKLAGQDFDQTATALGIMARSGKLGSDAGTSLKTMLLNLQPTTKAQSEAFTALGLATNEVGNNFLNVDGSYKDLRDISEELHRVTKDLTEAERTMALEMIFGQDAVIAASLLAEGGAEAFDAMAESMGKVSAEAVATERLDNLAGVMDQLGGSIETAQIKLGTAFLPVLKEAGKELLSFVNENVIPFVETNAPAWAEAIGNVSAKLKELADDPLPAVGNILKDQAQKELPETAEMFARLAGNEAIGAVITKLGELKDAYKEAQREQEETERTTAVLTAAFPLHAQALEKGAKSANEVGDAFDSLGTKASELAPVLDLALATAVGAVVSFAGNVISELGTLASNAMVEGTKLGNNIATGVTQGIANAAGGIASGAAKMVTDALNAARNALPGAPPSSPWEAWAVEIGEPIPLGAALGVEREAHVFYTAVAEMVAGGMDAGVLALDEATPVLTLSFSSLLEAMVGIAEARGYQERVGKSGADLMNALDAAITEASPRNIQTVARMADGILRQIEKDFGKGDALGDQLMAAIQDAIYDSSPENIRAIETILEQIRIRGEFAAEQAGKAIGDRLIAGTQQTYNGMMSELAQGWRDSGWPYATPGGGDMGGGSGISIGGQPFTGGGGSSRGGSGSGSLGMSMKTPGMRPPNVPGDFVFNSKTQTWDHPNFKQLVVQINGPTFGVNDLYKTIDQGIREGQIRNQPGGF